MLELMCYSSFVIIPSEGPVLVSIRAVFCMSLGEVWVHLWEVGEGS